MLSDTSEMLFLVARDFVQLTSWQQKQVGIKSGVVGVGILTNQDEDAVADIVFSMAYKQKKIPELVKQMRPYLYE